MRSTRRQFVGRKKGIIPCTGGEHWGGVKITINGNQLVLDPTYQEKARQLCFFLKGVPAAVVNHCEHAFSLIVVVSNNSDCSTLDVLYFIYLLLDVWVQDITAIF